MNYRIKNHLKALLYLGFGILLGVFFFYTKWNIDLNGLFLAYLGFVLALVTFAVVDFFRKPNFIICKGTINDHPDGVWRFVHVNVVNLDWPSWFFLFRRDIAKNTTAEIIFRDKGSRNQLFSIPGRWSYNLEPLEEQGGGTKFDLEKARVGGLINISPSIDTNDLREGQLGIGIKYQDDNDCYGFSDESYKFAVDQQANNFRKPEWRLRRGEYIFEVIVKSSRFATKKSFLIENLGKDLSDFQIKELKEC